MKSAALALSVALLCTCAAAQDVPPSAFGRINGIKDIVAEIEAGHRWAELLCTRSYVSPTAYAAAPPAFADQCLPQARAALARALKAGKVQAATCAERGIATGALDTPADVMRVSLQAPRGPGPVRGKVTALEGTTVYLYDPAQRLNAMVEVDKDTVLIDPAKVAVGAFVSGYGVQAGTRRVQISTGETTTVAFIKAQCL